MRRVLQQPGVPLRQSGSDYTPGAPWEIRTDEILEFQTAVGILLRKPSAPECLSPACYHAAPGNLIAKARRSLSKSKMDSGALGFIPPPSPPQTRKLVGALPIGRRRFRCFSGLPFFVRSVSHENVSRALSHGCDLQQRPEGGLGPDGHDAFLLDSVHVDRLQHRQEDASTLAKVGLLPEDREVLEELPGGDRLLSRPDVTPCRLVDSKSCGAPDRTRGGNPCELFVRVVEVRLNGGLADVKALADLLVAGARSHQPKHFDLSRAERLFSRGTHVAHQPRGTAGAKTDSPSAAARMARKSSSRGVSFSRYPVAPASTARTMSVSVS